MTESRLTRMTEDEIDALVSAAIHRAEMLDDLGSSAAADAWREVRLYEERLSEITPAESVPGAPAPPCGQRDTDS
jgi:hypothetical protein